MDIGINIISIKSFIYIPIFFFKEHLHRCHDNINNHTSGFIHGFKNQSKAFILKVENLHSQ